jgi:acyl-CoA synthetase (AMP-forming)/AMP-acid ligase II
MTVFQAFARTAAEHGARPFLEIVADTAARYDIEPRVLTYAEALDAVQLAADAFRSAGIVGGERVALLLGNTPECFTHWLALNLLGASVVPLNPDWRAAELEYALSHSEARLTVTRSQWRARLCDAAAHVPLSPAVVTAEELPQLELTRHREPCAQITADLSTECALLYTSGTTGEPKGCVLPNEYFLSAGRWYAQLGDLASIRAGAERLITPLPMHHMNAMAFSTMVMLLTGGCIVPLDRFHPESFWPTVRASQATILHYLGVMPALLLQFPAAPTDTQHGLRFGFGAGVSATQHAAFESRFGFPLLEAWAMTETGAGAAIIAHREPRKCGTACFGRPGSGVDVRIIDEAGNDVADETAGELLVRSAGSSPRRGFFAGYLKNPAATEEAWRDGFFHTGDIVSRDPDGHLHFIDRKKNVIRRSGENISAVEVEGVILQHGGVAAVGVAAVPDALRGDEVLACVVRRDGLTSADAARLAYSIVEFCLERLAYYKAPGYVAFCEELPLTATQKIQRQQLREMALALLTRGECVDTRDMKRRLT